MLYIDPKNVRRLERAGDPEEPSSTPASSPTIANVRTATLAMAVASALFVLFNSAGIRHFARDLPGNRVTDTLVDASDRWHALMLQLGPAHFRPAVRDMLERARSLRW